MTWKDPLLGRVINERYEVHERIGKGGFGVVYRVEHLALGKNLAMKALFRSSQLNQSLVQRFEREAKATCRIGHPNIVDVVDYGQDEQAGYYFIMEFVDGHTLQRELGRNGALKPIRAVRIGKQIASALLATHQNGIIHRDLKPENVMLLDNLGGQDFVKVLDYGVAGLTVAGDETGEGDETESDSSPRLTQAGMVFGTPHYMSPEQAISPDVAHTSDIYSFGVMLYEMVVGAVPFDAPNTLELLTKHRNEAPLQPSKVRPDVAIPAELEQVILKCLAKEPPRRWASAAEIMERLDAVEGAILRGVPVVLAKDVYRDSSLFINEGGIHDETQRTGQAQADGESLEAPAGPSFGMLAVAAAIVGAGIVGAVMFPKWSQDADTDANAPNVPVVSARADPAASAPPKPAQPVTPATSPQVAATAPTELVRLVRGHEADADRRGRGGLASRDQWAVLVRSKPPGATLKDAASGRVLGTTPLWVDLRLNGGSRALLLERKGHKTRKLLLDGGALARARSGAHRVKLEKKGGGTRKPKDPFANY